MQYRYLNLKQTFRKYFSTNKVENQENNEVVHGSYKMLLFDKRWKDKRLLIVQRDLNRCILCKSTQSVVVHHRQYHFVKAEKAFKPPWDYPNELLITLCKTCHGKGHRQHKVPIIYI